MTTEAEAKTPVEDAKSAESASSDQHEIPGAAKAKEAIRLPERLEPSATPGDFHDTTSARIPPPPTEENVAKAEAFLRSNDIRDVPTKNKRRYLESEGGLTPEEIDAALERVWKDGTTGTASASQIGSQPSRDGREDVGRRRAGSQHGHDDQFRGGQGHRRNPNNQHNQDDSYGGHRRAPMEQRRPFSNYPLPHDSHTVPPFMEAARASETEEALSSSSSLPAWAGGFTLGVFGVAALRWLNGGDFVMLPPPTASEPRATESRTGPKNAEESLSVVDEENADESASQEPEGEDEFLENTEYDEDEAGSNEVGDLDGILNGTARAQSFHADPSQPSYDDLVLEIRGLTAAIHSSRDVQERANRAVAAQVGKGLTDDAMGLLREKKTGAEGAASQMTAAGSSDEELSAVASLLTEVSGDLCLLKQSLLQREINNAKKVEDSESSHNADATKDEEEHVKDEDLTGNEDEANTSNGEEDPSNQIEKVKEKIQQTLTLVENMKRSTMSPAVEIESKSTSPEPNLASTAASTPDIKTGEETPHCESPPPQPKNGTVRSDELLEEAFATLANNNNAADLKAGAQLLYLYCLNISKNPSVPRYRKIFTNNGTFLNKVGNLTGAKELLSAIGFVERANFFEWTESEDTSPVVKARLDFALVALELMKNGSTPAGTASPVPSEGPAPSDVPLSAALSVPGVGKGMDLK